MVGNGWKWLEMVEGKRLVTLSNVKILSISKYPKSRNGPNRNGNVKEMVTEETLSF